LLGSYFLTHPPICKIRVDVKADDSPLTRGLGASFVVEDEPYFIELQDPPSTRILLTADYGPGATSPTIGTLYPTDTSLEADGKTRVLGYTRQVGQGVVAYFALGHCHNPAIRAARTPDPTDTTPLTFHGSWESDGFLTLLRNTIAWGVGAWALLHPILDLGHGGARALLVELTAGRAAHADGTDRRLTGLDGHAADRVGHVRQRRLRYRARRILGHPV